MSPSSILKIPSFLGEAACRQLIGTFERFSPRATSVGHIGNPVVYFDDMFIDNADLGEFREALERCRDVVCERFGHLYPETALLTVLSVGDCIRPHADNCRPDGAGGWKPNHTPRRKVSALMYLNQDFDGGEIVFSSLGASFKPLTGMLLAFPSGSEHLHEVLPVLRGKRYSLPVWFTSDAARSLLE